MTTTPITPEMIERHGLSPEEYRKIIGFLGREPGLVELGIFSVMWSEHCSYKSSKIHLKKFPTTGPRVVQGPGENAGAVDIGDGLSAVFKMESHNHPSFIEPFQGAATGVGGILRDIFTMGARPLALLNSLRFGPLVEPRNRFLMEGVVSGISSYGNCMGVPNIGGEINFNEIYDQNPLVNVFCLGVVKTDRIFRASSGKPGCDVIYVGSKTGRDGIHGATMASESFDENSGERRPTVQVGDPFTEKLLLECCLEIMKEELIIGIQDMGAAGLTSSSVEMASRGKTGIELDLSRVPRREEGMSPYEVMLSESQERMLMVAEPSRTDEILSVCEKWDLDAAVIGKVTDTQKLVLLEKGEMCAEIPVHALTEEAPVYDRPLEAPAYLEALQGINMELVLAPGNFNEVLLQLLSSPTIASKKWVYEQYDHMVRTNSVVGPGYESGVIRVKGTRKALSLSVDGNSRYVVLNPYQGGMICVAEAARNVVCSGARPIGLTDCLNFGNPERKDVMWQFALSVEGISDACKELGIPVVSGNVSFYNETKDMGIYPTPIVGVVGLLDDFEKTIRPGFVDKGDKIVLLGETKDELGGTEYLKVIHAREGGYPPMLDLSMEKSLQECCLAAMEAGIIKSAHDCSEGGLAVALAESVLMSPGLLGASIALPGLKIRNDSYLFGESQSRIIVTVSEQSMARLLEIAQKHGVSASEIGVVGGGRMVLRVQEIHEPLLDLAVPDLQAGWENSIGKIFNSESEGSP